MKTLAALLLAAPMAMGAWTHPPATIQDGMPPSVFIDGSAQFPLTPDDPRWAAAGWTYWPDQAANQLVWSNGSVLVKSAQQLADEAVAAAAVEAERTNIPFRIESPLQLDSGMILLPSMPAGTSGWALAVGPDGNLIIDHWFGSPTSSVPQIRASMAENAISFDVLRGELKTNKQDIAAIIDLTNTNINDAQTLVIATANATQTSQSVRRVANELVDVNRRVKDNSQELQDLRSVVMRLLKGVDK